MPCRTMEEIFRDTRTIAVVGLSPKQHRDSYQVAAYLQQQGYRIIPVNPAVREVLGERAYANLTDVPEPIDMVDVFRRPASSMRRCGTASESCGRSSAWCTRRPRL